MKSTKPFQSIKTNIKNIVKNPDFIPIFESAVVKVNEITVHTLQFMKLFLITQYEERADLPYINTSFIMRVINILTGKFDAMQATKLDIAILKVYKEHYQAILPRPLDGSRYTTLIPRIAEDIELAYLNNIRTSFMAQLDRFILTMLGGRKPDLRLVAQIRREMLDLRSPGNHELVRTHKKWIIPDRRIDGNVFNDLMKEPSPYLTSMIYMMRRVESYGGKKAKLSHCCPLRNEGAPKQITISTETLKELFPFLRKDAETPGRINPTVVSALAETPEEIWSQIFDLKQSIFNSTRYTFAFIVRTDAVSCSVLKMSKAVEREPGEILEKMPVRNEGRELYSNEIDLSGKRLVAIDPNMSDLLFCVARKLESDEKEVYSVVPSTQPNPITLKPPKRVKQFLRLRYTQNQRRKESHDKKYHKIIMNEKMKQGILEIETDLSAYNSKSAYFDNFYRFLLARGKVADKLNAFYSQFLHRKLRFNRHINEQRSESEFLNKFKAKFGGPEEVIIGIGDFEQQYKAKHKEPVKGKGFRLMFRRAGYTVCLVDEFRTSKQCYNCEGDCGMVKKVDDPRPWRKGKRIMCYGLLKCKRCQTMWCRDTNSALNILRIMEFGKERPAYLSRPNSVGNKRQNNFKPKNTNARSSWVRD